MKVCPICGKQNADGSVYCDSCGTLLAQERQAESQIQPSQQYQQPYQQQYQQSYQQPFQQPQMLSPVKKVSFGEAIASFFKNYANFKGRATRSEYWFVVLFNFLVGIAIDFVSTFVFDGEMDNPAMIISYIYALATIVPGIALGVRRLHDTGKAGTTYLILLIPLVGAIIIIIHFCTESDTDNIYGPHKTEGIQPPTYY